MRTEDSFIRSMSCRAIYGVWDIGPGSRESTHKHKKTLSLIKYQQRTFKKKSQQPKQDNREQSRASSHSHSQNEQNRVNIFEQKATGTA